MNNKTCSSAQERMIAQSLCWQVVTGSGSRECYPGDVISDEWLGECKTHNSLVDTISFMKSHWMKISDEAASKFRFPVLFVDNGSQKIDHTWALFKFKGCDLSAFKAEITPDINSKVNIRFSDAAMSKLYKSYCATFEGCIVFRLKAFNDDLCILPFRQFVEIFKRGD